MVEIQENDIYFRIPLQEQYIASILPVFQVFSERGKLVKSTAFRFQLTAEEFLVYFQHLFPDEIIEIRLYTRGRYCSILFTIRQQNIDLSGLNLINLYSEEQDEEDVLDNIGLLLIAQSVDKMEVFLPTPESCAIEASFERFSPVSSFNGHHQKAVLPLQVATDDNTILGSLQLSSSLYPGLQGQSYFSKPEGFLADSKIGMVDSLCVVDQRRVPIAFLYWQIEHGLFGRSILRKYAYRISSQ